nr:structural protein [Tolivirales sp.]
MPVKVLTKKKKKTARTRAAARNMGSAEPSAIGKLLRQMGTLGGGALGAYAGMPAAGSAAGNSLGAAISKWLGYGDYTVGTNSVVSRASTGIPMMHKDGQTVTVRHREFIATIPSSTDFVVQKSFQLNPGNQTTFPWLSTIANSFQEYRFKGVVFHYIPTSGHAISGTSPSLGSVMMQTSYRANDTAPSTKAELLNEYWSGEVVPSETLAHPIECNPAENPFNVQYVRRGDLPSGDNQLFYDLGVTHICTAGQLAAGNVLGDLWVTYEVELKKPIVASNVTSDVDAWAGSVVSPANATPFTGLTKTYGTLAASGLGNVLTFAAPPGLYLVTITMAGTGLNVTTAGPTLTNATLSPFNTSRTAFGALSSTAFVYAFGVTVRALEPITTVTCNISTWIILGTINSLTVNITACAD